MNENISSIIKARLEAAGVPFRANDNIADHIKEGELEQLQSEVEVVLQGLLESLVIDTVNDHNTNETAKRVAKMYIQEVFKGRYIPSPAITEFPNFLKLDEMYTTGPIDIRSACSHHLVPIIGQAWIGVIPGDKVVGLSKFNRLTDWVMSRPQIQEEGAIMLADALEKELQPEGMGVIIRAQHMCMTWRGVKQASTMVNSVLRGSFKKPDVKNEFMSLIRGQGF